MAISAGYNQICCILVDTTISLVPSKNYNRACRYFRVAPYPRILSQIRIKYGALWRLVSLSTRLLAGYFTTHAFHLNIPYFRLPLLKSGHPTWRMDICIWRMDTLLDTWTPYLTDGHSIWWMNILFSWIVCMSNILSFKSNTSYLWSL